MNRVSETEKPYQAVTRDSLRTSIDFFFEGKNVKI